MFSRLVSRLRSPALPPTVFAHAHRRAACSIDALEYASSCYLPTSWLELPLVARREHNHDSTIYSFGLPAGQSLDLPVCACLLLRAPAADGGDHVRPYTPISPTSTLGSFDLLVKRYGGKGVASEHLHGLALGDTVGFKHIKFNIKAAYPFEGKRTISLVCAGTGITPMVQALQKLVGTPGDDRQIVLLYSSKSPADILMKDDIDALQRQAAGRLRVVHVVGETAGAPAPPGWTDTPEYTAETGWIDQAKIEKYCFPPSDDTLLFVCGLPPMYEAICAPPALPGCAAPPCHGVKKGAEDLPRRVSKERACVGAQVVLAPNPSSLRARRCSSLATSPRCAPRCEIHPTTSIVKP